MAPIIMFKRDSINKVRSLGNKLDANIELMLMMGLSPQDGWRLDMETIPTARCRWTCSLGKELQDA